MDGQRFDHLVRLLGAGSSRRRMLQALGGVVGGGIVALAGRRPAGAVPCSSDDQCAPGTCCDGICGTFECCVSTGSPACPVNFSCVGANICAPTFCVTSDAMCGNGWICCDQYCSPVECCSTNPNPNERCPPGYICSGNSCIEPGCTSDSDCASGVCCGGSCTAGVAPYECCILDANPNARCPSGTSCSEGICSEIRCGSDVDCPVGICCGGSCTAGAYPNECCLVDADPDARCPTGTSCFEGACDPVRVPGNCCAALRAGLDCAANECCTATASPSDFCPAGSSCEPAEFNNQGYCCVYEGQPCLSNTPCCGNLVCAGGVCSAPGSSSQPTATATGEKLDKWALWSGKHRLAGATVYLRRLTAEDDPDVMGERVVGPDYRQSDFDRLAALGANYIDLSYPAVVAETAPFGVDTAVQDELDRLIRQAENADLFTVVSFRTGPGRSELVTGGNAVCQAGGCYTGGPFMGGGSARRSRLWTDESVADAWVEGWTKTAQRLRTNPNVIGYHVLAMPDPPTLQGYRAFMERVVDAIRSVDAETPILISAPRAGLPSELDRFEPLADRSTLYRVEAFAPARYLAQPANALGSLTYGEAFDPELDEQDGDFDSDWIEAFLKPALTWADDNQRPVAIGGYGMPRWQPGLEAYLDDLFDQIAEAALPATLWMWHPAKGPTGDDAFNLEHGPDPDTRRRSDNPLTDVLKRHWKDIETRPSTYA